MKLNLTKEKKELFIKTLLWNILLEVFQKEKKLDIEKYLVSIKIQKNDIIIKTNKPIFNSEAMLLDNKIQELFTLKLEKADIKEKFNLKYV